MNDDDGRRGREPGPEEIGSVADEAAKLFGALSGWAKTQGADLGHGVSGVAGGVADAMHEANEHLATGAQECTYCPICRTVHLVRELSPEVRNHLATASANLMQAAAAVLATAAPDQARTPKSDQDDLERIDLDDNWPTQ